MTIEVSKVEGFTYYTAEHRKVSYCARWNGQVGRWEVHSRRLALGPMNVGSWKFYETTAELAAANAAFRGLDQLTDEGA